MFSWWGCEIKCQYDCCCLHTDYYSTEGGGCSVCGYIFILLEESVDSTCFVLDICINECG